MNEPSPNFASFRDSFTADNPETSRLTSSDTLATYKNVEILILSAFCCLLFLSNKKKLSLNTIIFISYFSRFLAEGTLPYFNLIFYFILIFFQRRKTLSFWRKSLFFSLSKMYISLFPYVQFLISYFLCIFPYFLFFECT